MKIKFAVLVFVNLINSLVAVSSSDGLLKELSSVINKDAEYIKLKEERIVNLKKRLKTEEAGSLMKRYVLLKRLYSEYKTFKYDSAFTYALAVQNIARELNDPIKIANANMDLSSTLLSSGMYKETLDSLNSIRLEGMPDSMKVDYYELKSRAYYELAAYNDDHYYSKHYDEIGNRYSDSAIAIAGKGTLQLYFLKGIKELKEKNYKQAETDFQRILDRFSPPYEEYGMVASSLASVYIQTGNQDKAVDLMIKAAIADIKSSTKEGIALAHVADLLYSAGDEERAYSYVKQALRDAAFYGAKQRLKHVSGLLPIIEGDRLATVESTRDRFATFSVITSILSIIVILSALIIFKQLKQLKVAKEAVSQANADLQEVNTRLKETNDILQSTNEELLEANKIKEEYIGYSFNMYSDYLDKIEKIKKGIEKKVAAKSISGIDQVLDSIDLKKEREALYLSFDKIFKKLFPNFVSAFNSFFQPEDRFSIKEDQPLNAELRIFALIRIGISDPEQIAKILEYSIRTIYNYKTKVKNKSFLSNEEFENKIMEIKAF